MELKKQKKIKKTKKQTVMRRIRTEKLKRKEITLTEN